MSNNNNDNFKYISYACYAFVFLIVFVPLMYLAIGLFWSFAIAKTVLKIFFILLIVLIISAIVLKIKAKQANEKAEIEAAAKQFSTEPIQKASVSTEMAQKVQNVTVPVSHDDSNSPTFETSGNQFYQRKYISHDLKGNRIDRFVNDYVVIDVETSGLSYINSEIIELSAIKVVNYEEIDTFTSLVKPKEPIPAAATAVNGITNDMVADAPAIEEVLPKYLDFIGENIVIGHNVNFDIDFIYESSVRILNKPFSNNYSDTLPLAHQYVFGVENFKLGTLAAHFRIFESDPHRSLSDCRTTNAIYRELRNLQLIEKMLKKVRRGKIKISDDNIFCNKAIASKGMFKSFSVPEFNSLCNAANANILEKASADADYLVLGDKVYKNYVHGETSKELEKILSAAGDKISVLSENEFLRNLLPYLK